MRDVTVKRDELLTKLKANRDNHRELFLKAQEGYRKQVIEELEKQLEDARNGLSITRGIMLPDPVDHTDDYNTIITMVEMSVDDEIDLDTHSFNCYVMDKWEWSAMASEINTTYAASL